MRRIPLLILILCAAFATAFSQDEIPVDMYTGQPSITIPIWTVLSGDVSQPVVLSYSASGGLQNSGFGQGWSIATGSVSREVRNFPDDIGYNLDAKGWLYKNRSNVVIATDVGNFIPAADNSTTWDSDEGADHTKISTYLDQSGDNYAMDTEPDIFNYSAGGVSGSFVFDNDLTIRTIPYADVVITPTYTNVNDRKITKFTITTNDGYVYTFDNIVSSIRTTSEGLYANRSYYMPVEYALYSTTVTYTSEWKLTRIESPAGNYITLAYSNIAPVNSSWNDQEGEIGLYQYPDPVFAHPSDIIENTAYKINQATGTADITSITGSTGAKAEFAYSGDSQKVQTITISDSRRGSTTAERKIKTFTFGYMSVQVWPHIDEPPKETVVANYNAPKEFLETLTESSGCEQLPPYTFSYEGIMLRYEYPSSPIPQTPYQTISRARGSDLWGYPSFNSNYHPFPKLYVYPSEAMIHRYSTRAIPGHAGNEYIVPGADRRPSTYKSGILRSITSPEGGVTEFKFEPHTYLDPATGQDDVAGGVRIRQISYHDGFNPTPITKTFEYVDPATGLSSGRLIRKPELAVPSMKWKSPVSSSADKTFATSDLTEEEKYQYLLIRRERDLTQGESTQGSPVGYTVVTVNRPGAGYARFEFRLPAAWGDTTTGEWTPTVNKFARSSSGSGSMGIVDSVNTWGFPFTPNPNYDFERGLIWKKTDYTSDDKLVQQTITSYQRLYPVSASVPNKVWGLRYDRYPGCSPTDKIFFYGRYFLLTEAVNVPAKEVTIRYDQTDPARAIKQKDSVEYLYEGTAHRLLTKVKRYTSDGNLYTTQIKYPKDYTTYATGADDAKAIHAMTGNNRHSMPIETIQTFKKSGNDSVWVIGGSVVKLDDFGGSVERIRSAWALKASPPIYYSDFTPSAIVNASGYKFRIDARYERTDSVLAYTTLGDAQASYNPVSRKSVVSGYGYGYSIPVVQLANVQLNSAGDVQAAFSDFETTTGFEFTESASYYGTGRTGLRAFYPKEMLSKVVVRAPNVTGYMLSFWVKSNTTFTITITLRPGGGGTAYSSATLNIPDTGSEYRHIQKLIPLTGVPAAPGQFLVQLQASGLSAPPTNNPPAGGTSATLLNVIDDVFFYPENADMTATTYTIPYGAASVTSGKGATGYTEYDKLGRVKVIYDRNRNIVKRNVYQYTAVDPLTPDFSASGLIAGETTTFTAVNTDCVTDATYEWDMGAGFSSGSAVKTFTYDTVGSGFVKLRVTSAVYGTKTITRPVSVVSSPFGINICAKGAYYFSGGYPDLLAFCSEITDTPGDNDIIFKITNSFTSATYQWQKRDLGSGAWVYTGKDRDDLSIANETGPGHSSYEVRCKVTLASGAVGYSPAMQVIYEY